MNEHSHQVVIDPDTREILVLRVEEGERRTLLTKTPLPETEGWSDEIKELARLLGENILIDSPIARRLLRL